MFELALLYPCATNPSATNRWCGSNYDALGNARFAGGVIEGEDWGAKELTANATFVGSLNWGYTTFDNMGLAFLTIFQSITLEGWSDILYQVRTSRRTPSRTASIPSTIASESL